MPGRRWRRAAVRRQRGEVGGMGRPSCGLARRPRPARRSGMLCADGMRSPCPACTAPAPASRCRWRCWLPATGASRTSAIRLRRLVPHVAAHGVDRAASEAAQAVLRYFDLAAPDHHADEEQDLFPALLESMAGSDAVCLRELIVALTLAAPRARSPLAGAAPGAGCASPPAKPWRWTRRWCGGWSRAYRQHLAREDAELLPMAARLIGDAPLQQIGRAMRLRRGITSID